MFLFNAKFDALTIAFIVRDTSRAYMSRSRSMSRSKKPNRTAFFSFLRSRFPGGQRARCPSGPQPGWLCYDQVMRRSSWSCCKCG